MDKKVRKKTESKRLTTINIFNGKGYEIEKTTIRVLLCDKSSNKNIIWATDDYFNSTNKNEKYQFHKPINMSLIKKKTKSIIKPRIDKTDDEKRVRIKEKGEVFTPTWTCNHQNNSIDEIWFGKKNIFNREKDRSWTLNKKRILFPKNKTWKDYVLDKRIEITCGEAPYLVSRYDASSGEDIPITNRIGIIDRKIRVINENVKTKEEWYFWIKKAFQSSYGYEWQGDNVLIARLNLLFTFIDYHIERFGHQPDNGQIKEIAEIISWNIWQMDGLKFVIPESCKDKKINKNVLFKDVLSSPCEGCKNREIRKHTGIYSKVKDWEKNKIIRFIDILDMESE